MSKVKICGLKRVDDIEYVNELMPDFIGFVFAKSKRQVNDDTAKNLKAKLSEKIQSVGVFVNDNPEHIIKLCKEGIIDIIQLHGDEGEKYAIDLKSKVSCPIIRAVRVKSSEDIINAEKYPCDYLLLDTYVKDSYGGSGKTFDRKLIPENCKNYFLAGGLGVSNLKEALSECNPYAVDLSSGVETDGLKDKEKIRKVIEIVRGNFNIK